MARVARNRRFATEFKLALCKSIRAGQIGRREAERMHNLCSRLTGTWLRQYDEGLLEPGRPVTPSARQYEQRIADLERMVGRLTMETDQLRQALGGRVVGNDDAAPDHAGDGRLEQTDGADQASA